MRSYYVYIITNKSGTLYVGMTNNLFRRILEHKTWKYENSFSKRYNIDRLIYYEHYTHVYDAIDREKEIKGWRREKKIALIASKNPDWKELAEDVNAFIKKYKIPKGKPWDPRISIPLPPNPVTPNPEGL